jgi:hypothetical protein
VSLLVGPFVVLALLCAVGLIDWGGDPLHPVALLLGVGLLFYLGLLAQLRRRAPLPARAQTHAWTVLAPRLHADRYHAEDAAFLAGLAQASVGDGVGPVRQAILPRLVEITEAALGRGEGSPVHLAPLVRLLIDDEVEAGEDPAPLIANRLARCFEGRLPFSFAERLLARWKVDWNRPGHRARLRILLCDRAFAAGFEVRNLVDAGRTAPALGALLGVDRPDDLAALRLLWSLRATRPWDRCGPASTVFELAEDPAFETTIADARDLLLFQREASWPPLVDAEGDPYSARLLVCRRGVLLNDALFTEPPSPLRVVHRGAESELVAGPRRFQSPADVEPLAARLEAWVRYFFKHFRPAIADALDWAPPDRSALWRAWGAITCPECGRPLLPRVGEVGVALDVKERKKGPVQS